MKRKKISEYLDQVGGAISRTELLVHKCNGDGNKVTAEEFEAVKVGLCVGIALSTMMLDGEHEPKNPIDEATTVIAATLDYLHGGNDD